MNITQALFNKEMSVVPKNQSDYNILASAKTLSSYNTVELPDGMKTLMPVFIRQAHLSTYYQDNPFGILSQFNTYGVEPMGGNIDYSQPSGHKGV